MSGASFATLINKKVLVPSTRTQYIAVDKNYLVDLLKPVLRRIHVDEAWYLQSNPDVVQAIDASLVNSGADHYVNFGYYEHRMPYEINVDEAWYLAQYPDVADAVSKGVIGAARDHFYAAGFKEGRIPYAGFSFRLVD
jgi:hypothetical protein